MDVLVLVFTLGSKSLSRRTMLSSAWAEIFLRVFVKRWLWFGRLCMRSGIAVR